MNKSKSKKAFKENVRTEIAAGKPVKQALAIAYSVKESKEDKEKYEDRLKRLSKK